MADAGARAPNGSRVAGTGWPFVGRAATLAEVGAALAGDRVSAVLLCGPSGAGKTRLAEECAARAAVAGRPVIPVTASPALAQIPLGALVALLTSREVGVDAFSGDFVRLFAHARRVVAALGPRRPVMLVDDLPALDPLSAAVVAQLVQAGAVVLLATVRDGEAVPDAFLGLWSSDRGMRVDLAPLRRGECHALLAAVLGGPVSARSAADLHRISAGNMLYLRELVLGAGLDGSLTQVSGVWRLVRPPAGTLALHELLAGRLRGLAPDERAVLERLALCGSLAVDELPTDADRTALARLDEIGLARLAERGGRLFAEPSHPHYASVIRGGLSRLRAADLLVEQADLVQARAADRVDALRVATWRLEATGTADPALLLRAARLARLAFDFPAVARLAGAAAAHAADLDGGADLLLLLGEAERELGRPDDALATLARAACLPSAGATGARIAELRAATLAYQRDRLDEALEVLRAARAALPGQAVALASVAAALLGSAHRTAEALSELDGVAGVGPLSHEQRVHRAVAAAPALAAAGRAAESIAAADDGVAAAGASGALHPSGALMVRAVALAEAGRIEDGLAAARAALGRALDDGLDRSVCSAEWRLARVLLLAGRPRSAARWCRDVVSGARAYGLASHLPLGLWGLAVASAWLGEAVAAREALAQVPASGGAMADPWHSTAAAWVLAADGNGRRAGTLLLDAAERATGRGQVAVAAALLHDAVRLGHADLAAAELTRLARRCDSPLVAARAAHATAAARNAVTGLSDAADTFEGMGAVLLAAEAAAAAGRAARAAGSGRAATALIHRARTLAGRCEGACTPGLFLADSVEPLTAREREVATLAAAGLSSRTIAERLVLSVRTVDNHLQASYAKLGISGRAELSGALRVPA